MADSYLADVVRVYDMRNAINARIKELDDTAEGLEQKWQGEGSVASQYPIQLAMLEAQRDEAEHWLSYISNNAKSGEIYR